MDSPPGRSREPARTLLLLVLAATIVAVFGLILVAL